MNINFKTNYEFVCFEINRRLIFAIIEIIYYENKVPLLNISTNKKINNKQLIISKSSDFISSLLNKPENFVMVKLTDAMKMYFAGTNEFCCFIEIKSIGSIESSKMSKPICEFFSNELGIPTERIYIFFQDVDSKNWAWNSKTFG